MDAWITNEYFIAIFGAFLLLSVFSNKLSSFLGLPSLLIFLAIGMLAGSEGVLKIEFTDHELARSMGEIALMFILFSGGLNTEWDTAKTVLKSASILSTLGVLLTALLVGLGAYLFLDLSFLESLLLGSIVSSTDAAAVFAILRSKKISLKKQLQTLIEIESASNDPMAIVLTMGLIILIVFASASYLKLLLTFLSQMVVGAAVGMLMGRLFPWLVNRIHLEYKGLYSVLTMGYIFAVFALSEAIFGNGLLAVYLTGLFASRREFAFKKELMHSYDGTAWLMQIIMFIVLGLLVMPSQVFSLSGSGLLIALFLMLIARPVAVFICLLPFHFSLKERTLISWVGLRGAVPIILSTFPLSAGIQNADLIFNLVFFIVIASVLIQGTTLPYVAKALHLQREEAKS